MSLIRKLIREEVAKSVPFEHDIQIYKNTDWKSNFFLGNKPYTGKDFDYPNRKPEFKPVENVRSSDYKSDVRTEREKDYDKWMSQELKAAQNSHIPGAPKMEEEKWMPSSVRDAPRIDPLVCGAILKEFEVNKFFEDVNGGLVFHIALKDKMTEEQQNYVPGGAATKMTLKGIADKHGISLTELKSKLRAGVQFEMKNTNDELVALGRAMDNMLEDPMYYHGFKKKGENHTGISAYAKPNANSRELKMIGLLERFNKMFGTLYYIGVAYPNKEEDIFVIKSGKIDESGKGLVYDQFIDVDKVRAEQEALLRWHEAANGLKSITTDNTPWREVTEPLDAAPVRSAVMGSSARNV